MYRHQGQSIRSGGILAAELVNAGKVFRAVYFEDPKSSIKGSYYTPEGKSLRKAFLRSPLEFSRITSGFTNARLHPILQQWRAHKGVDYGAPTGTKVRATGEGTVEFIGRQGGYGNLIILRHQGRYSTAYGHLSSFTPNCVKALGSARASISATSAPPAGQPAPTYTMNFALTANKSIP